MKPVSDWYFRLVVSVMLALSLAPLSGGAAESVWNGSSSGTWNTDANWTPSGSPAANTVVYMNNSPGNLTQTLGADVSINGIAFKDLGSAVTVNAGNTLTLGSGGIDMSAAGANLTLNNAITLGATNAWNVVTGRTLTVGGSVANGGYLLTVQGAGSTTVSGIISGAGGLTKNDSGVLTLSGSNIYSGITTVSGGTLRLAGGSAIPDAGAVSLTNTAGAGLELTASETIGSLSGGGTTGGNVNLNANTLTVGNGTYYDGVISGSGALIKSTSGALYLRGTNTYMGGTTVSNGYLCVVTSASCGTGNITVKSGASYQIYVTGLNVTNAFNITGNGVSGAYGAIDIWSAVTNEISGPITVTGTAMIYANAASKTLFSGVVSGDVLYNAIYPTATLELSGANNTISVASNWWGILRLGNVDALKNSTLDTAPNDTFTANRNVTFGVPGTNTYNIGALRGGDALDLGGNSINVGSIGTSTTYAGPISGTGGGLIKSGVGTLELSAANTFSGVAANTAGTLKLSNVNALMGATLDTGASGSQTVTFAVSGNNTYNLGGLQGAADLSIGANSINVGSNGTSTAYSGVINGTGGLTKSGAGTLTLSGTNTYNGTTTINSGTLRLEAGGMLNPTNAVTLSGGTLDSGSAVNHLGTLTVAGGTTNTLRIGTGGELSFEDSSTKAWNGQIAIEGSFKSLRFGTTRDGLTQAQLEMMQYQGKPVRITDNGYVVLIKKGTVLSVY